MASEVEIILSAKDNASPVLKGGLGNLRNLADAFNEITMAADTVGRAVGQAYDFIKSGVELELTRGRFDRLSESIGTTSDALLDDLKAATRGTRSEMDLMESTTDFLSLGLAKNRDEVVRLTRVAGALGMNMNQLVLTLTNRTTMRFDALGVSVDGFDEKVKALEQSGLDVNAAFTEAFLQQAEEQIDKVGDVADTTAGDLMKMEANISDLNNELKLNAAETAGPAISGLAGFTQWTNIARKAVEDGTISQGEANNMLAKIATTSYTAADAIAEIDKKEKEATKSSYEFSTSVQEVEESGIAEYEAMRELQGQLEDTTDATEAAKEEQDRLKDALSDLKDIIGGPVTKEYENFQEQNEILRERLEDNIATIEELETKKYLTEEQKEALAEARENYDENQEKLEELTQKHEDSTARIIFGYYEQEAARDGLTEIELEALTEIGKELGIYDEKTAATMTAVRESWEDFTQSGAIDEVTRDARELQGAIDSIDRNVNIKITTTYTQVGKPPSDIKNPTRRRQHGGAVWPGEAFLVGERGPELFLPSAYGIIAPNQTTNYNMTINEAGRAVDPLGSFMMLRALAGGA